MRCVLVLVVDRVTVFETCSIGYHETRQHSTGGMWNVSPSELNSYWITITRNGGGGGVGEVKNYRSRVGVGVSSRVS